MSLPARAGDNIPSMDPAADSRLAPGTMLAHYRLGLPLGAGGMGTVYDAHDTALDRRVAVKVLRTEVAADETTVARFVREARAAARVSHPNLAHVYFVGTEGTRHFFAMEYLPGRTLEQAVREEGPFDLGRAVDVLVRAGRGLHAAHEAGLVHRDVKPGNLILLPDGTVKVTDFGLAKSVAGDADATGSGTILGTPRYMSPEQCRGEALDRRTDLYSLGLLGWFLLAGRHPYDAPALGRLLDDQMNRPLPPLAVVRPDLPGTVQGVLARLAAKSPADRPTDAAEAIALLEGIRPRPLHLAPIATRIVAFGLDLVLVAAAVGIALAVEMGIRRWMGQAPPAEPGWPAGLAGLVLLFLSQAGLEAWLSTTAGKRVFHLRVVRADGTRVGLARAAARFALCLPVVPLSLVPLEARWWNTAVLLVQGLALLAAAAGYFFRGRRTLADALTATRVVLRGLPA